MRSRLLRRWLERAVSLVWSLEPELPGWAELLLLLLLVLLLLLLLLLEPKLLLEPERVQDSKCPPQQNWSST